MISLGRINWEVKVALVFAITALIISLFTGLAAGNDLLVALVRAVVLCIVFGLIGFGSIFALKKYVPEIYDILSMQLQDSGGSVADIDVESQGIEQPVEIMENGSGSNEAPESAGESVEPVYDAPPKVKHDYLDSDVTTEKSMGKHQLKEKALKFSPKLMAEAVRTMMSKDKD